MINYVEGKGYLGIVTGIPIFISHHFEEGYMEINNKKFYLDITKIDVHEGLIEQLIPYVLQKKDSFTVGLDDQYKIVVN